MKWFKSKLNKQFVSEIDQFLASLRATIPQTTAQKRERAKSAWVAQHRDDPRAQEKKEI